MPTPRPARLRQALRAAPYTARLHGTLGGLMAELEIATGGVVIDRRDGSIRSARCRVRASSRWRDARRHRAAHAGAVGRRPRSGAGSVVLAGGAVTRGEIVVLEGFRLRRTFATILGADLADENDPLTLGLAASGNSFVGDTLILGDAARREMLGRVQRRDRDGSRQRAGVIAFFERLAHRVLVLVRRGTRTADLKRLHRASPTPRRRRMSRPRCCKPTAR